MNENKLNAIKDFYKTIMTFTGGCMPRNVTESLLECFIYEDDSAWWAFMYNLDQWYNTLPDSDLKAALDHYYEFFDCDD